MGSLLLLLAKRGGVSMTQVIKAGEQNLVAVFGDSYLFHIPLYQRPYAWTREQVDELLDDLLSAQKRDQTAPYFLGSIVLIKDGDDPQSAVVDGQQRLTTLTMILCVLRELADLDRRQYLDTFIRQKGNPLIGTRDQFRLSLRKRDRQFFEDHIQTNDKIHHLLTMEKATLTDIQLRITDNVGQIMLTLSTLSDDDRWSLASFIVQQCFLVVVTATDRDSAYRIFSVMNDRGLDLSPTDILKAEVIGSLDETEQSSYAAEWESVEERLGRDDFRDLFTHIRMIRVKAKMRQTLQADFLEHVLRKPTGSEFIDDTLVPYAEVYETVRDASYESTRYAEEVNRYLGYLGRLDNFDWIPPAMTFFHQNAGDSAQILGFTKDLERLAYGLFILRANINKRIKRYAQVLGAIERGDSLFVSEFATTVMR